MRSFTPLTTLALAAITSLSSAYYFEPRDHENYHPSQHQHLGRAIAARYADAYAYAYADPEALPKPYIVSDDDYSYNYLSARDASFQYDNYDYDLLYRRISPPSPSRIDTSGGGSFFGGPMVGSPSGSPSGSPGGSPGAGSQGSFFGGPMVGSPTGSPPGSPGAPPPPGGQGQKRPAQDDLQSSNPKKQNTASGSPPGSGGSFFGGPMSGSPGSSPVSSPGVSPPTSPMVGSPGSVSPMSPSPPPPGPPQRQQSVYNAQLPAGNKKNPDTKKYEPVTTPNIRNQGEVNTQALANARAGGRRLRRRWTV